MKFQTVAILLIALALACCCLLFWQLNKIPKVAYVRTQLVLDRYKGMQDAKAIYQKKVDGWKSNYDSLEFSFNKSLQEYNTLSVKSGEVEKKKFEESLKNQSNVIEKYGKTIDQKASEENEKLTQGVLNQVNEYIKKYAESNSYDIVLGITLSGNILYGSESTDITEQVITGLNNEYSDGNKK